MATANPAKLPAKRCEALVILAPPGCVALPSRWYSAPVRPSSAAREPAQGRGAPSEWRHSAHTLCWRLTRSEPPVFPGRYRRQRLVYLPALLRIAVLVPRAAALRGGALYRVGQWPTAQQGAATVTAAVGYRPRPGHRRPTIIRVWCPEKKRRVIPEKIGIETGNLCQYWRLASLLFPQ